MADITIESGAESSVAWRKWAIYGGRLLLAAAIILFWEYEARTLGPLFFALPLDVLKRIGTLAMSGQMITDVAATMRVSGWSRIARAPRAPGTLLLASDNGEPIGAGPDKPQQKKVEDDAVVKKALELLAKG